MLKAVFFDVGDTLVAPYPSFAAIFAATCRREGVELSDADAAPIERRVGTELAAWRQEGRRFSTSAASSREFWVGLYGRFLAETAVACPPSLPERVYARFVESETYRPFPDVLPALQTLRGQGLRLGVISNWEEWLERLLQDLGLLEYFEVLVVSGVEGREKPHPELFHLALARMGVAPERALHVGDSPESDCAPAVAAGMGAVLLDRRERYPGSAYRRITSLTELTSEFSV